METEPQNDGATFIIKLNGVEPVFVLVRRWNLNKQKEGAYQSEGNATFEWDRYDYPCEFDGCTDAIVHLKDFSNKAAADRGLKAQHLAEEFTRVMIEWLAPDELDSIKQRKSDPSNWCDDNVIMDQAWKNLWPTYPSIPSEIEASGEAQGKSNAAIEADLLSACALWGDAVDILRESNYFVGGE